MHFLTVAGLLALSGAAAALSDSSPWALLSTSKFHNVPSADQIQSSSQVLKFTRSVLSECPTDRYLIVLQPGLNAADLRQANDCSLPHLCSLARDSRIQGTFTVSEVLGKLGDLSLSEHIESSCSKQGKAAKVDQLQLSSLSGEDRAGILAHNDAILARRLETATDGDSFTVLFLSSPNEPVYEADFAEPLQTELKRRQEAPVRQQKNKTEWDDLPLFEKYQFFTPGIFTAIVTAIVLLSILGVGLRALGSLEVSYGAFEKDMGPAAQKKTQ
ncbi:Protein big1 [Escovopsis weberi]|uniref:Protein BIG1 n=1 Tax=Escovopsis weberi TaxID=150374 RepID=A0A0M9VSN2_ESCWE|nr:Protein big1 [Escovopsis weberi]